MTNAMKTLDLGNNESVSRGVVRQADGTYLALGYTRSKTFKTATGAQRWLDGRSNKTGSVVDYSYNRHGVRVACVVPGR